MEIAEISQVTGSVGDHRLERVSRREGRTEDTIGRQTNDSSFLLIVIFTLVVMLRSQFFNCELIWIYTINHRHTERGWTLQECLCPTRITEFGTRQTRWTCLEIRSSKPAYKALQNSDSD